MSDQKKLAGIVTVPAKDAIDSYGYKLEDVQKFADGKKITVELVEKYRKSLAGAPPAEEAGEEQEEETETEGDTLPEEVAPTPEAEPQPEAEAASEEAGDGEEYFCLFRIKEDGEIFLPGKKYTGKRAKELLANHSIKVR